MASFDADMDEKILLDKPETEDDTSIPKDLLGVKAFPGSPDVTEDDMDVTSGPRDFLGKPTNSMQKTESVYSQMTRALTEAGPVLTCPKCHTPDVRIKHEGDMCPPCEKAHPEFGNMDDSVQEMTTAADIATVPMGFKVDPEDKPTPEETAETGISLTGAPNRVPESHQRLPHLTAFLEEFGGQPGKFQIREAQIAESMESMDSFMRTLKADAETLQKFVAHMEFLKTFPAAGSPTDKVHQAAHSMMTDYYNGHGCIANLYHNSNELRKALEAAGGRPKK